MKTFIQRARECGKQAAITGKSRVPALDRNLVALLTEQVAVGQASPLFSAWLKGWDTENLKDN